MTEAITLLPSRPADEARISTTVKPADSAANDPLAVQSSGRPVVRASKVSTELARRIAAPILGLALFIALWAALSQLGQSLPGPLKTWHSAVEVFSDPFYRNGPNDQGIGWNVLASLQRVGVGIGFGMAALIGIPLGFMLGRFRFLNDMLAPIISLLRPVSPLAWLPIGLLV